MRLPRFRFTIRRMMVAVAIVGVAISAEAMRRRRITLLDQADRWAARTRVLLARATEDEAYAERSADLARGIERGIVPDEQIFGRLSAEVTRSRDLAKRLRDSADEGTRGAARQRGRSARADALARKYIRAARYPWLPVAPDPPMPE